MISDNRSDKHTTLLLQSSTATLQSRHVLFTCLVVSREAWKMTSALMADLLTVTGNLAACVCSQACSWKKHLSWCVCRCFCFLGLYPWHTADLSCRGLKCKCTILHHPTVPIFKFNYQIPLRMRWFWGGGREHGKRVVTGLSEGEVISAATLSNPSAILESRGFGRRGARCGSEESRRRKKKRTEASCLIAALFWMYLVQRALLKVCCLEVQCCKWGTQEQRGGVQLAGKTCSILQLFIITEQTRQCTASILSEHWISIDLHETVAWNNLIT